MTLDNHKIDKLENENEIKKEIFWKDTRNIINKINKNKRIKGEKNLLKFLKNKKNFL